MYLSVIKESNSNELISFFEALENGDEKKALEIYKDLSKDDKCIQVNKWGSYYPLITILIEQRQSENNEEIKNCLLNTIKNVVNDSNINDYARVSTPGAYTYNYTPLMEAIKANDVDVIKILLQNKNIDLYCMADEVRGLNTDYVTALSFAIDGATRGHLEPLALLLQHESFDLSKEAIREDGNFTGAEYLSKNIDYIKKHVKELIEDRKPLEIPKVENPGEWTREFPQEPKKPLIPGKKYKKNMEDYNSEVGKYYSDKREFNKAKANYGEYVENLKEYEGKLEAYNQYVSSQSRLLKFIVEKTPKNLVEKHCDNGQQI